MASPYPIAGDWTTDSAANILDLDFALNVLSCLLQLYVLYQNRYYQRKEINCHKKELDLDSLALRLNALDHGKEEIRRVYKTYESLIETELIVMTLIFPYALSIIQFSDPFMPTTYAECPTCVESSHVWVIPVWVCLMGVLLVLPFWGILLLLRTKWNLDKWLAAVLRKVRDLTDEWMKNSEPQDDMSTEYEDNVLEETDALVQKIVRNVDYYERALCQQWIDTYGRLVQYAHCLLVTSITLAVILTAISVWIYLYNSFAGTGDIRRKASSIFLTFVGCGCPMPFLCLAFLRYRKQNPIAKAGGKEALRRRDTVKSLSSVDGAMSCCIDKSFFRHAQLMSLRSQSSS